MPPGLEFSSNPSRWRDTIADLVQGRLKRIPSRGKLLLDLCWDGSFFERGAKHPTAAETSGHLEQATPL